MRLTEREVRRDDPLRRPLRRSRSTGSRARAPSGRRDWFFFVNGVESEVGAAEYELSPGRPRPVGLPRLGHRDARAGDRRRLPGAVPARDRGQSAARCGVECDDAESEPCRTPRTRSSGSDVPVSGSSLGAPGTEQVTRLVVARWPRARIVRGALDARGGAGGERRVRALLEGRPLARPARRTTATSPARSAPATAPRWWRRCARAPTSWSGS